MRILALLLVLSGCGNRHDGPSRSDETEAEAPWEEGLAKFAQGKRIVSHSSGTMRVSGAGDVNGDGFDDVLVADSTDTQNGLSVGAVHIFLGGPLGIDRASEMKLIPSAAPAGSLVGMTPSRAGDVNGDGYDDVIVGIPRNDAGAAYVYLGSASGIDPDSEILLTSLEGAENDYFGCSVSGAGDLNGDGYDDVVVGASMVDSRMVDSRGSAYVFLGSVDGVVPSSEIQYVEPDGERRHRFGSSVSGAGDIDGDGFDDVIIGSQHISLVRDGLMSTMAAPLGSNGSRGWAFRRPMGMSSRRSATPLRAPGTSTETAWTM